MFAWLPQNLNQPLQILNQYIQKCFEIVCIGFQSKLPKLHLLVRCLSTMYYLLQITLENSLRNKYQLLPWQPACRSENQLFDWGTGSPSLCVLLCASCGKYILLSVFLRSLFRKKGGLCSTFRPRETLQNLLCL